MVALSEKYMPNSRFLPVWRHAFEKNPFQFNNPELKSKINEIKLNESPLGRIKEALFALGEHHLPTLYHSYEVAIVAYRLGEYYYEGLGPGQEYSLKKIFIGGLIHDLGKLGVKSNILNRFGPLSKEEKGELIRHGKIGEIILEDLELREFVPFANQHHVGNSGINTWTQEQLNSRPPLIEFISLADFLVASLDSRRKYKKPLTMDVIKKLVRKKTQKGIFSEALEHAFLRFISENKLPPYSQEDFDNDKMYKRFFGVK